jgi:hypothetical protein
VALLTTVVILIVISLLLFQQIVAIVHGDLYSYGLVFNYEWSNPFMVNSYLYFYSLVLGLVFIGIAILFLLINLGDRDALSASACSLLVILGAAMIFLAIYSFSQLDYIVNHELYFYGLVFSTEWFDNYSLYSRTLLSLVSVAGVLAVVSSFAVYISSKKKVKVAPTKLLGLTFIAVGTVTMAFSIMYDSSILTLASLGLLFWGVTFTYVSTEDYVRKVLLETTVSSQCTLLNQAIQELEFKGDPIYLPPQLFGKRDVYKAYISKYVLTTPSTLDFKQKQEPEFLIHFIENPPAVLITPPGAELVPLFEKTLKTDFREVNLLYLQQNLPKLLTEDLEIANYFDVQFENEIVRAKIDGSLYIFAKEERDQSNTTSFNSPIIGAIAFVIAKTSGHPVMVVKPRTSIKGRNVLVEYILLDYGGKENQ